MVSTFFENIFIKKWKIKFEFRSFFIVFIIFFQLSCVKQPGTKKISTVTVLAIAPASASVTGGSLVIITGTNFASGATVKIGNNACVISSLETSEITCAVPSNSAGTYDVVVSNASGVKSTLASKFTYVDPPVVTSVSPNSGITNGGTSITIIGRGFKEGADVLVGGSDCMYVSVLSDTAITCQTPSHSSGVAAVKVTNTDNLYGNNNSAFIYRAAPTLASISLNTGALAGGTIISISGSGFYAGALVDVGGAACTPVSVVNSSLITCTTSAHIAGSVTVTVTNLDGQFVSLANGYTYRVAPIPTAMTVAAGSISGGVVATITGTGFDTTNGATVTVGGTQCTMPIVTTSTSLQCTLPNHTVGVADIVVTNIDNQSGTLFSGFTFYNPPTVSSVSPATGFSTGTTVVTITGVGFRTGATVDFSGAACATPVVNMAGTSITCTAGAHSAGAVNIQVSNTDAQYGVGAGIFTYRAAPTVTSISPSGGALAGGTLVTITGTGFYAGGTVSFGGSPCTPVTFLSATSMTCTTTSGSAGTATVTVTNADTQTGSGASPYTYREAPTIASIVPNTGQLSGGSTITITGANFISGATVTVGGNNCTTVIVSTSSSLQCTTPSRYIIGSVSVVVKNADNQSATLNNAYTYLPSPTVSNVKTVIGNVNYGTSGLSVVITGTNFISGATADFGGTACTSPTVNVAGTTITCALGVHALGAVNVQVTNPDSQIGTATNAFTYTSAPTVTAVSLSGGSLAGGTYITITGTDFYSLATVTIGPNNCTGITVVSSTSILCTTPAYVSGATSATVAVTNINSQTGNLAGGFTYRAPPTISNVSLSAGPLAGGAAVVITGTGFITSPVVLIGGLTCTNIRSVSATSITCDTPAKSSTGSVSVVVTNTDNQTATLTNGYTYLAAPTITSLSLNIGPIAGGSAVTIYGTNFVAGALVTFDNLTCTVTSVSSTGISCLTPADSLGIVAVIKVINPDAQNVSVPNAYTYVAAPTVTNVSPIGGSLSGGTAVTITGTGFYSGASVTINGASCTGATVVSSATITCTSPAGTAGAKTVAVTNGDLQTGNLPGSFTYQAAPTISNLVQTSGFSSGGLTVTINGSGFTTGVSVSFGGVACPIHSLISSSVVQCDTPAHADGVVDVAVTNTDNQFAYSVSAFTYRAAPTFTSISPSGGPTGSNTPVTITGSGFYGAPTVNIGALVCASVVVVSNTQMTCTVPSHSAASYAVKITNPDTQNITSAAGAFTFSAAPAVAAVVPATPAPVSPLKGGANGGTLVNVTGTGFQTGASVDFGGATCSGVVFVSSTHLQCTTSSHGAGAVFVTVTNTDSQSDISNSAAFTYVAAPTITSVSSSSGTTAGGGIITITGTGFLAGDTVKFGTLSCTPLTVVSSTSITCTVPANATLGAVDVSVTDLYSQVGTALSAYTYRGAPIVSSVSPSSGALAGSTLITITGSGFYTGALVSVGGSACTSVTVISPTSITCLTASHGAGATAIVVTNADTQSGTLNSAYTYQSMPALITWQTGASSPTPPGADAYGSTSTNITHTYTLKNTGDVTSSAITIAVTGTSPGAWITGTNTCTTLAANATCTVQETFLGQWLTTGNSYSAILNATATTGGTSTNTMSGSVP